jgi:hypothetical protein
LFSLPAMMSSLWSVCAHADRRNIARILRFTLSMLSACIASHSDHGAHFKEAQ